MKNMWSAGIGVGLRGAVERTMGAVSMAVLMLVLAPPGACAEDVASSAPPREKYPQVGLGLSAGGHWAFFDGADDALAAVEEQFRQAGFEVGPRSVGSDPGFYFSYNVRLQVSSSLGLLFEYGDRTGSDVDFTGTSASVLYRFPSLGRADLRPFAGAGVGRYSFEITENYGQPIGNAEGGGYFVLDAVVIEGADEGYIFRTGFDFSTAGRWFGTLYVNYVIVPSVETDEFSEVTASVTVNSLMAGLGVTLVFP